MPNALFDASDEPATLELIDDRDRAVDAADKLTAAVALLLGVEVGEHSNGNDPWQNALTAAEACPTALGYVVLLHEHGRWDDNWDGQVHPSRQEGLAALAAATEAGFTAVLTAAVAVTPVPEDAEVGL